MWFGTRRAPRIGDELRFHRDRLIEAYMAEGLPRGEAERRALLEFGGVAQIEEAVRDVRGRVWSDLLADLRYALRMLRRNPGFAAVAVLSLALGIGANVAIFTVIDAVMLQALPVKEPGRLVHLTRLRDGQRHLVSYPFFEFLRDRAASVSGMFAHATSEMTIVVDGEDELATVDRVSGEYYRVLGLAPAAGRLLEPRDLRSPSPLAAVISERYWQRRFGRSPSAIGRPIAVGDRLFTIVGMTPAGFHGPTAGRATDVTLPLLPELMGPAQRQASGFVWLNLLARLAPGVTVAQANAEIEALGRAVVQSHAAEAPARERARILRQRVAALPAPDGFNPIRERLAAPLVILLGIVGLILMLACVNLSGLLLARAAAREREISIRLAIGAGRGRLVRQFLTESLLLAALGGGGALAIAGWFGPTLCTLLVNAGDSRGALAAAPGWRVLAFTCAVSLAACGLAGLAPAWQAVRVNVNPALKEVRAHRHRGLGRGLVIAQLAMSMVLLVGATLFVYSLVQLYAVDRGFDSDGVLVINLRASQPYPTARTHAVQSAVIARLKNEPGVHSVSAALMLPAGGGLVDRRVQVEGDPRGPDELEPVGFNVIAPDYFATLRTPLVTGRDFTDRDTGTAPSVAIVNAAFARFFFGDRPALGRRVTSAGVTYQIVGVVGDAKYASLRDAVLQTMYIPWTQRDGAQPTGYSYLVRTVSGDPMRLAPGLDAPIRGADPALRVRTTRSYTAIVDQSIGTERILGAFAGLFGLLALIVASLGVFGTLAFQVARRTNEFGVRMALGASRRTIMGSVLREVIVMLAVALAIGAGGALMLTGLNRNLFFGVTAADPGVFVIAASALAGAAIIAAWLPARRAARVDPLIALRHE